MIKSSLGNEIVDVCIVGSGIGGSTLALKLAEKGISFVIVEAGGVTENSDSVDIENIGRDFGLRTTTAIQLGGTTNLWHGVLSPLDKIDFEKRDWIENSGWEISLDDLDPFYEEASKIFNVKDYSYFTTSELSKDLNDKINDMPFDRNILKNKMFQQPLPVKNFKKDILNLVKKSSKHHLLLNTVALELLKINNEITVLKCGKEDGTTFEIKAKSYIIAAGALETPRLLLNSNINNNNIGNYLMDHPMSSLCQLKPMFKQETHIYSAIKYIPSVAIKTGLELYDSIQKEYKLPNHTFYMRPSFTEGINNGLEKLKLSLLTFKDGKVSFKDAWKVITNINVILQVLLYKFSLNTHYKFIDLFFVTEQTPLYDSNVTLSSLVDKWGYNISKVNWKVSDKDKDYMNQWYELIVKKALDSKEYQLTHKFNNFDWNTEFTSAAHHVGTCRMSDTKENGVVDKNLKVFEIDNLYVCDGSVFTTSGNVNNGFTIAALACRLAKYIKEANND